MSTPLPPGNEVKYFEVLPREGEWITAKTLAFEFKVVDTTLNSANRFTISHTPGPGFPCDEYAAPEELLQYCDEVGAKLTLNCTYKLTHYSTFLPKEVVVGCELLPLA